MKKLTIELDNGKLLYLTDEELIKRVLDVIPKDIQWKKTAGIRELRNTYFFLLTELNTNINTGYSKSDLHNALKPLILNKFKDMPHYFKDDIWMDSTSALNYTGWLATIEQLKVVANDIFGYIFK